MKARPNKGINYDNYFEDIKELSQGDDMVELKITISYGEYKSEKYIHETLTITWNKITYLVFPKLIRGIRETGFKSAITSSFKFLLLDTKKYSALPNFSFSLSDDSFETIKIQLLSLGYIEIYLYSEAVNSNSYYKIRLTKIGEQLLLRQRALKRED